MESQGQSVGSAVLRWIDEVRQSSVAEFSARHPGLHFLVQEPERRTSPIVFETIVPDADDDVGSTSEQRGLQVVLIQKSQRSPYQDRISVGRARNCDIVIRHPSVSKLHAHIRSLEDGGMALVDVGSHNGTRMNERELEPNKPVPLRSGDVVVFGSVTARALDAVALHAMLSRAYYQQLIRVMATTPPTRPPPPSR